MIDPLKKYIYNKNICIVGPAPYLDNIDLGNEINSYDIIIKINGLWNIDNSKYGNRTDILYINKRYYNVYIKPDCSILDKMILKGVKLVIGKVPLVHYKNQYNMDFSIFPSNICRNLKNKIGSNPLTGTMILDHCIKLKPKDIFITGFDFYRGNQPWINGYNDQKHPDTIHSENNDLKYFIRQFKLNKFFCDDHMKSILKEN